MAALSDVHGNLPALEAVLAEVEDAEVDLIVFGGDLAAGPMPRETLDRLLSLGARARFLRGNADREAVEAFDPDAEQAASGAEDEPSAIAWVASQLSRAHGDFLAGLPEHVVVHVGGLGPTLFCHGSPRTDMEILTADTPDTRLREAVAGVGEVAVVCGHTHMQFDRTVTGKRVVNPGSVGLPYEGAPGAYWAVLGPDVDFKRTTYDPEGAAESFRATGYPGVEEYVQEYVLSSHSREEATEFFERLARDDPRFAGAR